MTSAEMNPTVGRNSKRNKSHGETRIHNGCWRICFDVNVRKGARTVKRDDPIESIVRVPETEEMQRELAKRVAVVHAQTVMEKLAALSGPVEQKVQLIDAIIEKCKEHVAWRKTKPITTDPIKSKRKKEKF